MLIRKYEPRKATAEEARRYFLQYHSNLPTALTGTAMEKEAFLNAQLPSWLRGARRICRLPDVA